MSSGIQTDQAACVSQASFTFTTIYTPNDHRHPVSGNRQFGFRTEGNRIVFYTRGVDRPTTPLDAIAGSKAFEATEQLWRSWQARVLEYVSAHRGAAVIGPVRSIKAAWSDVRDDLMSSGN